MPHELLPISGQTTAPPNDLCHHPTTSSLWSNHSPAKLSLSSLELPPTSGKTTIPSNYLCHYLNYLHGSIKLLCLKHLLQKSYQPPSPMHCHRTSNDIFTTAINTATFNITAAITIIVTHPSSPDMNLHQLSTVITGMAVCHTLRS